MFNSLKCLAFVSNLANHNNMAELFIPLVGVNLLSEGQQRQEHSLTRKDNFRCQIEALLSNNLRRPLGKMQPRT